ncbi:MAG: altronate dehydratase [Erysipelotrichaceae bacterium]|jgi:altronate hydrolase|nr:altronate dehydratase [Erysipelotrichaceae bacterium]MCR5096506.1 altronate dehydratase family protein [Erysipelotrichaceae bacterium]
MKQYIRINENDNVVVALVNLKKGFELSDGTILNEDIDFGHKIALCDIPEGGAIIKYNNLIGYAKQAIRRGDHVHTHNIRTSLGENNEYRYEPAEVKLQKSEDGYFEGFMRKDGSVGVRNEIWIMPTVGCVNSIVKKMERLAQEYVSGSLEAVVAFNHPYGCSQMGDDQENTREILADLIRHPNAGGVLVVGLGCENSNIEEIKKHLGDYDEEHIKFMICQEHEDEVEYGMGILKQLSEYVKSFKREKISVDKLIVGLKCGGSDGLSGISANPCVGKFSDILISKGGTTILTEVPEMFGAEQLLMNRAINEKVFEKTVALINNFKDYFRSNNQTIYENPSPGNKKGGISTLEDKSNGCVQKSGSAAVVDVLEYGDRVSEKGLNLLSAPGNDLVASTALAAAGAHIVLFTTGRGTPFASPVPTVKISSNSTIYERKKNWIDFNAGALVDDENLDLDTIGQNLYEAVVAVASGKKVKAEEEGYHDLAIFKKGVTL